MKSLMGIAILALTLPWALSARATDVSYNAQTAGSVLTPWAGTISGTTNVVDAHAEGETLVWISDLELAAIPPIPNETWWPVSGRATVGWQLFQIILDWILGYVAPSQPSALALLTGDDYSSTAMLGNVEFGIQVTGQSTNHGGSQPASTGSCTAYTAEPFYYCLNQYTATAVLSPLGPGAARLVGHATLPQENGSNLILDVEAHYYFDPSLTLDGSYLEHHEGAFSVVEGAVQTLIGQDRYTETHINEASVEPRLLSAVDLTAYPNPSHAQLSIDLSIDRATEGSLAVFESGGRRVRTVHVGPFTAGMGRFGWDGRDEAGQAVASGVYLLCLRTGAGSAIRKVMIAR